MGSQDRKRVRARGRLEINPLQPLGAFRDQLPPSLPCAGVCRAPDIPGAPLLTPSTPAGGFPGAQVRPFFPGDPERGLAFPLGCSPLLGLLLETEFTPLRRKVGRNRCGGRASLSTSKVSLETGAQAGLHLISPQRPLDEEDKVAAALRDAGRGCDGPVPAPLGAGGSDQCPHPQATGILLCTWTRGGSPRLTPRGQCGSQASHLLFLLHTRDRPRKVRPSARTSPQCLSALP